MALELADHPPLLELVDLDHRRQQLEVVARVRRQLLERQRVLGEAVVDDQTAAGDEGVRAGHLERVDEARERPPGQPRHPHPGRAVGQAEAPGAVACRAESPARGRESRTEELAARNARPATPETTTRVEAAAERRRRPTSARATTPCPPPSRSRASAPSRPGAASSSTTSRRPASHVLHPPRRRPVGRRRRRAGRPRMPARPPRLPAHRRRRSQPGSGEPASGAGAIATERAENGAARALRPGRADRAGRAAAGPAAPPSAPPRPPLLATEDGSSAGSAGASAGWAAPTAIGNQSCSDSSRASLRPAAVTNGWSGVQATRRPMPVRTSTSSPS